MKIAMLFPGQGSQYVGMGKMLCEQFEIAKKTFQEANDALDYNIQKLCFEGSLDELTKTENSQPAILTASVAAFRVYTQEIGAVPDFLAGHSLGEYSALVCAGGIDFTDAVKIVRQRGRFMQEAVPIGTGAMAAIAGIDSCVIEKECEKYSESSSQTVGVSNYNAPDQTVISGNIAAIEILSEKFTAMGAHVVRLNVSAPFHCSLMQQAADNLNKELQKYSYNEFKYPVIANINAQPYKTSDEIVDTLTKQVVNPVRWSESMNYLKGHDVDFAIEMGPKTVLKNLMKRNIKEVPVYSFETEEHIAAVKNQLPDTGKQSTKNRGNLMLLITRCMGVAVCTKNSNWDDNEYQKGVVEPYRSIKQKQIKLEEEGIEPTLEQAEEALLMLKSVFKTKGTSEKEQVERFNQILKETGTEYCFQNFIV